MNIGIQKAFLLGSVVVFSSYGLESCKKENLGEKHFLMAKQLFEEGNNGEAKKHIDSIKIVSPKDFDLRREGKQLMRKIELSEQKKSLAYCDSMIVALERKEKEMEEEFVLQTDEKYDTEGYWVAKSQSGKKNYTQSMLLSSVDKQGRMNITSVYCGGKAIKHTAIKVSVPDGEYALTEDVPYDAGRNHRYMNLGLNVERIIFNQSASKDVIEFIDQHSEDKKLKLEFLGEKTSSIILDAQTKENLKKVYDFSVLLLDKKKLQDEKMASQQRIEQLEKNILQAEQRNSLKK